jgi:hypothetical protein
MRNFYLLSLSLFLAATYARSEEKQQTKTIAIARTGFLTGDGQTTYRLVEVFQVRGKWILTDVGYIDFGNTGVYRETFIGAGWTVLDSKQITIIEEGYFDQASGPSSKGAMYFQPWTYIGYKITSRLGGETVYFPYLPLNKAGRVQHVVERAKLEYDFKYFKVGGGYGGYRFGSYDWQHKPFITATLKAGRLGNFEVWLQRMPSSTGKNHAQVQLRYFKAFN